MSFFAGLIIFLFLVLTGVAGYYGYITYLAPASTGTGTGTSTSTSTTTNTDTSTTTNTDTNTTSGNNSLSAPVYNGIADVSAFASSDTKLLEVIVSTGGNSFPYDFGNIVIDTMTTDTQQKLYYVARGTVVISCLDRTAQTTSTIADIGAATGATVIRCIKWLSNQTLIMTTDNAKVISVSLPDGTVSTLLSGAPLVTPMSIDFDYSQQCIYVGDYGSTNSTQNQGLLIKIPYTLPATASVVKTALPTASGGFSNPVACLGNGLVAWSTGGSVDLYLYTASTNIHLTLPYTIKVGTSTMQYDNTHDRLVWNQNSSVVYLPAPASYTTNNTTINSSAVPIAYSNASYQFTATAIN